MISGAIAMRIPHRAGFPDHGESPQTVAKIPKDVNSVYVRVDQNMLYWVKGDEIGSANIW